MVDRMRMLPLKRNVIRTTVLITTPATYTLPEWPCRTPRRTYVGIHKDGCHQEPDGDCRHLLYGQCEEEDERTVDAPSQPNLRR